MATIIYAPIISEARGKVADCVFSVWKGRPYIRQRVIPANPQTAAQTAVRESLARVVDLWQSIQIQLKEVWNTYGTGYRMSGFNMFMSQNRADEQVPSLLQVGVPNADLDPVVGFAAATGAGAGGDIDLTWTNGTVGADKKIYVLARKTLTDEFTLEDSDTTLVSADAYTISGLDADTEYDIYLLVEDCTNDLFSLSAAATATSKA